jgi:hypothetical protein
MKDFGSDKTPTSTSDQIFFDILGKLTPNDSETTQSAALVLMAYYFESCDLFIDPKN